MRARQFKLANGKHALRVYQKQQHFLLALTGLPRQVIVSATSDCNSTLVEWVYSWQSWQSCIKCVVLKAVSRWQSSGCHSFVKHPSAATALRYTVEIEDCVVYVHIHSLGRLGSTTCSRSSSNQAVRPISTFCMTQRLFWQSEKSTLRLRKPSVCRVLWQTQKKSVVVSSGRGKTEVTQVPKRRAIKQVNQCYRQWSL